MMTRNHRQEALSRAYVQAVAAQAGVLCSRPDLDYGIDLSLRAVEVRDHRYHDAGVQIDLQLKSSTRANLTATALTYDLHVDSYNDLRATGRPCQCLLIVLVLPEDEGNWLSQSPSELAIRHCAYWLSLEGFPATTAVSSVRVELPLTNAFSVEAIRTLLARGKE